MEIVLRSAIIFFFLWALLRVMGRRELSEMTPFDLVVLIVIGDLIQQGVTQGDVSMVGNALAAGTMVALAIIISTLTFWFKPARRVFKGIPLIVVRDGDVYEDVLKSQRIDLEFLNDAARQQGIGDLGEVMLGVLEPDGMISFVKSERNASNDTSGSAGSGKRT